MAKIVAYQKRDYSLRVTDKQVSIADAVTGSVELAGDDDGQLDRISSRLTNLAKIVGALAEYAVRSGDEQLGHDLAYAIHWRYSIEVE